MDEQEKREKFDTILEEILDGLPGEVKDLLKEIAVVVQDEPTARMLEDLGIEPGEADLCGLHSGIPLPDRSVFNAAIASNKIFLFRGPILRVAGRSARKLEEQIRVTLLHEIGHHFGFSERKLRSMGFG